MTLTEKKILLMGNPNVGKSSIFSRLTGARVSISNYPGTTVGMSRGTMKHTDSVSAELVDVPGIYNLNPVSKADKVAVEMLKEGDIIINIVDATNLERNLFLTLELLEKNKPVVVALNMWDETKHRGVEINPFVLEAELGVPVVPVCGITGQGIKELVEKIPSVAPSYIKPMTDNERWEKIGRIIGKAQVLHHHHHTFLERVEDITTRPATGLPFALIVIIACFYLIRGIAESLINYLLMPFFEQIWLPVLELLKGVIGKESFISYILIGQEVSGKIDIEASFGLLTTGLYVPIGAVLPYIISFYFVLGFLEDTGYLPRLATQVDNVLHKIGLHGYAVVPMVLAMGCNVPGALATRLLETRREKFIAMTLMAVAVPCMAQIAMIVGLVGERGGRYVALIFGVLFSILIVKGLILNRFIKGASPEVLWEIPPYRMPQLNMVIKKLSMRISGFIAEALPIVLAGVFVINILNAFKVFDFLSSLAAPLLTGLWGLPRETISALVIGFFRKDVAVGMLAPLDLTTKQLVIACTVLSIYFPCIATFLIMIKELGIRDMARSAILMVLTSIIVGTFLNLIL